MSNNAGWKSPRRHHHAPAPQRPKPLRTLAAGVMQMARAAFAEPYNLVVERTEITLRRLPAALDGLRIVQLSD
ncbi:MAG TPA: hypothetical protein VEZ40_18970, partial [Pyrinomonadaceae bacterium]|nr:hypothetical protein [Pyrinomonadaceae bacterium]